MILYSMMNAHGSLQDKGDDMANECFSIKGVVSLIDKNTGKVLFTKHNMITNAGREYIKNLFITANSSIFTDVTTAETRKIAKIKFGQGRVMAKADDTALNSYITDADLNITSDTVFVDNEGIQITADVANLKKRDDVSASVVSELGIFLNDEDESNDQPGTMFSRIAFDPIPYDAESTFTIIYKIYFD